MDEGVHRPTLPLTVSGERAIQLGARTTTAPAATFKDAVIDALTRSCIICYNLSLQSAAAAPSSGSRSAAY